MLTSLIASSLVLGVTAHKELTASAAEILAISLPKSIGSFKDAEPKMSSSEIAFDSVKAKDLFGHALDKGQVHSFEVRRMGSPENKAAMYQIRVAYLPSPKHATLHAMIGMAGSQRAKWPNPGFDDRTKEMGKTFGSDQVWAWTGNSSWSGTFRVNRAVVHVSLLAPRPVAKDQPAAYTKQAIADWQGYVKDVIKCVKACPLNN